MPRESKGTTTRRKAYHHVAPRLRAASSSETSNCARDAALERNTSGEKRTKYAKGTIANVPTSTRPIAKIEGFAKAVIRLIATTVPGSAHGSIIAMSTAAFPRNFIRAIVYAHATPSRIAPTTAIALISRLFRMAFHDCGFRNSRTKFAMVYCDGNAALRQEPLTENAKRKIIAIGSTTNIVDPIATTKITAFQPALVIFFLFCAPPFDSVA